MLSIVFSWFCIWFIFQFYLKQKSTWKYIIRKLGIFHGSPGWIYDWIPRPNTEIEQTQKHFAKGNFFCRNKLHSRLHYIMIYVFMSFVQNIDICCFHFRETIAFCMQKARELGSKGKKKSVDKEKRPEWNFLQRNWHLPPFQGLILTQVIGISH